VLPDRFLKAFHESVLYIEGLALGKEGTLEWYLAKSFVLYRHSFGVSKQL